MNAAVKPVTPWQIPAAFAAMAKRRQWFIYRLYNRDPVTGKYRKEPIDARTRAMWPKGGGGLEACTTWETVAQVVPEMQAAAPPGELYLPGYWLTADGPWFLDLDECLVAGAWAPLAAELLAKFPHAAREVSSSGRALHVFGSGTVPPHSCKAERDGIKLEFYTAYRGVAMPFTHAAGDATADCTEAVAQLVAEYFPPRAAAKPGGALTSEPVWYSYYPTLSAGVDDHMQRPHFRAMVEGGDRRTDESQVDFDLCCALLRINGGNDEEVLEFLRTDERLAKLRRDKWEREDYLWLTIANAHAEVAKSPEVDLRTLGKLTLPEGASLTPLTSPTPAPAPPVDDWPPDPANFLDDLQAAQFDGTEVPPALAEYALLYSQQTGIDSTITVMSAVVCAGAAIHDRIQLCADSSTRWFAQARIWGITIGHPGSGKSPAERAMLEPLWEIHVELFKEWQKSIEGLKKDEWPPQPRVIVGDTTIEALSNVLVDNPRGVLIATDEFESWLGTLDMYKGGGVGRDRGEWLRLFDGGPHQIERVQRGTVYVHNWGVSILTATTPDKLEKLAAHLTNDGLLARFLPGIARRQQLNTSNRPDPARVDAARERYRALIRNLHNTVGTEHGGVVMMSPAAARRFMAWRLDNLVLQEALGSLDPALEGHIAKHPTLALRLALVFHCVRRAAMIAPGQGVTVATDPTGGPLALDDLELAFAFLRRTTKHARAMYVSRKGGSRAFELARDIARHIVAQGAQDHAKGLQRRDLTQRVRSFRGEADERVQAGALRMLIDFGWLREVAGGYGKALTRFEVNPRIAGKFAALAERERARRAVIRQQISEAAAERREGNDDAT